MGFYPIVLDMDGRRCVVVGGGRIAARKVRGLRQADAHPIVIAPDICKEIREQATAKKVEIVPRAYQSGDIEGAAVVIAATDDSWVNQQVAHDCQALGILVNVADCPDLCTFYMPAVVRRGELVVAISTGGSSPAFARYMRQTLESVIDSSYEDLLEILADLRPTIREQLPTSQQRPLWHRLLDGEVLGVLREKGPTAARTLAIEIACSYGLEYQSPDDTVS
jgi:siroheme synthase-like protein